MRNGEEIYILKKIETSFHGFGVEFPIPKRIETSFHGFGVNYSPHVWRFSSFWPSLSQRSLGNHMAGVSTRLSVLHYRKMI